MGAAALSGHQHGDDLPGPALCLHFWLFGIWFWPSVGVAPAKSIAFPSIALFLLCMRGAAPLAYAAIPWVLDIPDDPDAQFYAWATQKSVAYLRFFLRMLPVIAIFILP